MGQNWETWFFLTEHEQNRQHTEVNGLQVLTHSHLVFEHVLPEISFKTVLGFLPGSMLD